MRIVNPLKSTLCVCVCVCARYLFALLTVVATVKLVPPKYLGGLNMEISFTFDLT